MRIADYPVGCYGPGCGCPAEFKIAARWSDEQTCELKTYFLACPACLPALFQLAGVKHAACPTTAGETLAPPAVYRWSRTTRDRELVPLDATEVARCLRPAG